MSIQALVWVIEHSQSRLSDRCVLVSIANHINQQGKAWPGVDTISHEAKVSPRQVQISVTRLTKTGELSVARNQGPRRTNLYELPMMAEGNPALLPKIPEAEMGGAESAGVQNPASGGAESCVGGRRILRPGAQNPASGQHNSAPEPSLTLKPSLKPSSPTPSAPISKADSASSKLGQPPPLPDGALIPNPDPWALVKKELKQTIDRQSFETWIIPMLLAYTIDRLLMVRVPNAEWEYAKEHFGGFVKEAMKKLQLPYDDFDIEPEGVSAGGSRHRG
jgi:hypothetical protein